YFFSDEGLGITLLGGYTSDCADRVVNPSNTILDGGGSSYVLGLLNTNGGDIYLEGFTIQNGAGNYYGVGILAESESEGIRAAGDVTLNNNIIKGNIATGNYAGAGVFARSGSGSGPTGNVTLTNNTITGNTSGGWAGGVEACTYSETGIAGDVILTNNIITGNMAYDNAGGVEAVTNSPSGTAGNIILTNNTITGNTANSSGGGLSIYQPADRNLYVYNNIIWGNTAPEGGDIYFFFTGISSGYNNDYSDTYGSWTNSGNNINEDPLFVGGGKYQLQDISPCIDAGDNSAPELPEFDFVGSPRIIDGDGDSIAVVDMGAYEYVIYNLTIETSNGGTTDPSPGIHPHLGGTEVTITALPDDNYRFSGWAGDVPPSQENDNPITITMDSDKSVTANFIRQYTLTISTGTGGTTDPSPGSYLCDSATQVTIQAIPNSGYQFSNWSGDASGTTNLIIITMDSDKSITANFTATPPDNGDGDGKKGGCFIATAAYGSSLHPNVKTLRDFRDKYLMSNKLGRKLVDLYYKYSPFLANFIAKHKVLKVAVRISLLPLVAFSYSMDYIGPIITAITLVFIFVFPIFLISFFRRKQPPSFH
ncbi:MAG: hypothetical protein KAV87_00070, partial [Desulfobacteraceae bacterium]|nr:hypothetical protein [Desulfobacteraceae bacterium]